MGELYSGIDVEMKIDFEQYKYYIIHLFESIIYIAIVFLVQIIKCG